MVRTLAYSLLADLILVAHLLFVGFVVLGFIAIWIGWFAGWEWVRNRRFRTLHLIAMGFVLVQAVFERVCPLTDWEMRLRILAGENPRYETTFMQYWFHHLLYWDLSETGFLILYAVSFALIVLTVWIVRPRRG